ncbi:MAG: hypothetical protein KDA37_11785, partial [Planctomycetales bacterium]|nr:hypothetical protein [Planctomycetales bacterium]
VNLNGHATRPAEICGDAIQIPAGALFVVSGYGRASGNFQEWQPSFGAGSGIQVGADSTFDINGQAIIGGDLQLLDGATLNADSIETLSGSLVTVSGEATINATSLDPVILHDINLAELDPMPLHPRSGGPVDAVFTGAINVTSPLVTIDGNKRLEGATLSVAGGSVLAFQDETEVKDTIISTTGTVQFNGPLTLTGATSVEVELLTFTAPLTISGDTTLVASHVGIDPLPLTIDPNKRLTLNTDTITSQNQWHIGADAVAEIDTLSVWVSQGDVMLGGGSATIGGQSFTSEATVTGNGAVFVELLATPRRWINDGKVIPGFSPGVIQVNGDYEQTDSAELRIEIGGLTPGTEHDVLSVAGAATLDGYLIVELLDQLSGSFLPALGDTFEVLTADGGLAGGFSAEVLPNLGPLLTLHVFYEPNAVKLAVVPALSGDYNADGVVDAADYTVWRDSAGVIGIGLTADGDYDGHVTRLDYDIWASHYGETLAGVVGVTQQTGPEPGAFASTLAALFLGLASRLTFSRSGPSP